MWSWPIWPSILCNGRHHQRTWAACLTDPVWKQLFGRCFCREGRTSTGETNRQIIYTYFIILYYLHNISVNVIWGSDRSNLPSQSKKQFPYISKLIWPIYYGHIPLTPCRPLFKKAFSWPSRCSFVGAMCWRPFEDINGSEKRCPGVDWNHGISRWFTRLRAPNNRIFFGNGWW